MSIQDFKIIGNGISLYEPEPMCDHMLDQHPLGTNDKSDVVPPALIIMCTWLGGASDKRIQRYTRGYHHLWPNSSILLIRTSNAEYAFWSARYLRRKLRPAIHAIRRINARVGSRPVPTAAERHKLSGTLLHIFSNGGAYVATQLVASMNTILSSLGQQSGPMPLRQIVFDSCPGMMDVERGYQAAARALPPSFFQPLGRAALYLAVVGIVSSETLGIRRPLCETVQEQLNDPVIFDPGAVRVYLSSTADDIVYTEEVLAHRDKAAIKGLRTETAVFNRAPHCALVRESEHTYWGTIASAWERGDYPAAESAHLSLQEIAAQRDRETSERGDHLSHQPVLVRSRL